MPNWLQPVVISALLWLPSLYKLCRFTLWIRKTPQTSELFPTISMLRCALSIINLHYSSQPWSHHHFMKYPQPWEYECCCVSVRVNTCKIFSGIISIVIFHMNKYVLCLCTNVCNFKDRVYEIEILSFAQLRSNLEVGYLYLTSSLKFEAFDWIIVIYSPVDGFEIVIWIFWKYFFAVTFWWLSDERLVEGISLFLICYVWLLVFACFMLDFKIQHGLVIGQ